MKEEAKESHKGSPVPLIREEPTAAAAGKKKKKKRKVDKDAEPNGTQPGSKGVVKLEPK